jgi:hypothetical protein
MYAGAAQLHARKTRAAARSLQRSVGGDEEKEEQREGKVEQRKSKEANARRRAMQVLYCCFTAALLLLYYCFTTSLLLLYYCFTTALLLLYYCRRRGSACLQTQPAAPTPN